MTRLEKYLLASASEIMDAETTESRYFVIGNVKLRVSDHVSKTTDADIQVIIPYNGGTKYLVTIKESAGRFLSWNAKQIQDFIPAFQIMKGLKAPVITNPTKKSETKLPAVTKIQMAISEPELEDLPTLKFKGLIKSRLKQKNLNVISRVVLMRSKSTWNQQEIAICPNMLRSDLGIQNACVNEDIQIFLSCTSINYEEFLNVYKIIVLDNKLTPTIRLLQKAYSLIHTSAE